MQVRAQRFCRAAKLAVAHSTRQVVRAVHVGDNFVFCVVCVARGIYYFVVRPPIFNQRAVERRNRLLEAALHARYRNRVNMAFP